MPSLFFVIALTLQSILFWYEFFYPCFFVISICMKCLFHSLIFNLCVFSSEVSLLEAAYRWVPLFWSNQSPYIFWLEHLVHWHLKWLLMGMYLFSFCYLFSSCFCSSLYFSSSFNLFPCGFMISFRVTFLLLSLKYLYICCGGGVIAKLCLALAIPWAVAHTRLLCPWVFSRQEYWSGLPFPSTGDLPNPGIEFSDSCTAGRFLTSWDTRKALSVVGFGFVVTIELIYVDL